MTPSRESVGAIVRELARRLRAAGRAEPEALAEWAVATALGIGRAALRAGHLPTAPTPDQLAQVENVAARLLAGEPFAYAVGWTEFCGRRFRVDRRVLIPRPETEELAELTLRIAIPEHAALDVWDVGTGSGVLAITIALERPLVRVTATDVMDDAIAVARSNAEQHGVSDRIRWRVADLLGPFDEQVADVIVSNPPYVPAAEIEHLDPQVRDFEPRAALDGGGDGLAVIRRLIPAAARALRPGGWLCLEIGETQGCALRGLLEQSGFADVQVHRDLAGRERFAIARRS